MGDTGSLALGGFVAACGYLLEIPLYIAIVGIVYLLETATVILQVVYFKFEYILEHKKIKGTNRFVPFTLLYITVI